MSEAATPVRYLQSISYTQSGRVLRRIYSSNAYLQSSIPQLALTFFVSWYASIQVPVTFLHIESMRSGSHSDGRGAHIQF